MIMAAEMLRIHEITHYQWQKCDRLAGNVAGATGGAVASTARVRIDFAQWEKACDARPKERIGDV